MGKSCKHLKLNKKKITVEGGTQLFFFKAINYCFGHGT